LNTGSLKSTGGGGGLTAPAAIASEALPGGDVPATGPGVVGVVGVVVVVAMPENTGWSSGPVQCSVPFSAPASGLGVVVGRERAS
jgi:hypothetical protein